MGGVGVPFVNFPHMIPFFFSESVPYNTIIHHHYHNLTKNIYFSQRQQLKFTRTCSSEISRLWKTLTTWRWKFSLFPPNSWNPVRQGQGGEGGCPWNELEFLNPSLFMLSWAGPGDHPPCEHCRGKQVGECHPWCRSTGGQWYKPLLLFYHFDHEIILTCLWRWWRAP